MHNCDSLRHQMVCAIHIHFHSVLLHVMAVVSPLSWSVPYTTALVDSKTRHPNSQEHGLVGSRDEATGLLCSKRRQTSAQLRVWHALSCSRNPERRKEARKAERKHNRAQRCPEGECLQVMESTRSTGQGDGAPASPWRLFWTFLHWIQIYCKSHFPVHMKLSSVEITNANQSCVSHDLPPCSSLSHTHTHTHTHRVPTSPSPACLCTPAVLC